MLNAVHDIEIQRAEAKGEEIDIPAKYEKAIGLQLLGLMGKDPGHMWTTVKSHFESDAPGDVYSTTHVPGETPYQNVRTTLLDNLSSKPWKLIVLNGEQMALREMRKSLASLCPFIPIQTYGEKVDCIYFGPKNQFDSLHGIGSPDPRYKITNEACYLVPTNPKSAVGKDSKINAFEFDWTHVKASNARRIIQVAEVLNVPSCPPTCLHWDELPYTMKVLSRLVTANRGAYICGAAGVGKTYLIKHIKQQILEEDPHAHIISMALTHVAARLAQGCTIAHALRKFARVQDAWIVVDEASQVPLSMLGEISRWGLVGCKFIIVEDRIGQFLPIFDTWKADLRKLPNGSLMKNMCRGLHIQFDTYRT